MKAPGQVRALLAGLAFILMSGTAASSTSQLLSVAAPGGSLPLVVAEMLSDGVVESGTGRGLYAISVEVSPPPGCESWELRVRSGQPVFRSSQSIKPCTDLLWKLDSGGAESYQPLQFEEALVTQGMGDRSTRIFIDVSVAVDWETAPGHYLLDLVFVLVCQ